MNWFVSSDREIAINLDNCSEVTISAGDYRVWYQKGSTSQCQFTPLNEEQYNELIKFIDPSKKDQNNFGAEYYVKSELPKSTPEPTPTTLTKDGFVFKDIIEYDAVNSEQKQSVREHAVLNEILEINEHIKCDNCKKNIYIGDTCFPDNFITSVPLDRERVKFKLKLLPTSSVPVFCSEKCKENK